MVQREAGFTAGPRNSFSNGATLPLPGWRRWASKQVAEKWSARKTLAFVMLVCGAFWAALITILLT